MKLFIKASVAAVALALTAGANAARIDLAGDPRTGSDVAVLILNDAQESLLVNTQVDAEDLWTGAVTSYSSTTQGITAGISAFLAGSTKAKFYAYGAMANPFDVNRLGVILTRPTFLDDVATQSFSEAYNGFASAANFNDFSIDADGDGPDIENTTGIIESQYQNVDLFSRIVAGGLDSPLTMLGSDFQIQGRGKPGLFETRTLGDWTLSSSGELSYAVSAVPVPAAVWLFGSGLVGLVGVARRRAV